MKRRRVLTGFAAGVLLLTGCMSDDSNSGNETTQSTTNIDESSPTPSATTTATITETTEETATQTSTTTPIPSLTTSATTPTPSLTSISPSKSSVIETAEPGTVTRSILNDFSNRETYISDLYSYSIKYPENWKVYESHPSIVRFAPIDIRAEMVVSVVETTPQSDTPEEAAAFYLRTYPSSVKNIELIDLRKVTLPNGRPAILLDVRFTSTANFRQNVLITVANNFRYTVAITIPESAYTSAVSQQLDEIVTSFTIQNSYTSG